MAFKKRRLAEFFLIGLLLGIIEDLIAIHFSTGATIGLFTILIAFLVALPFAIFSELIVDRMEFSWKKDQRMTRARRRRKR